MKRNILVAIPGSNDDLRDRIDRHRLITHTVMLVGVSQLLLVFSYPVNSNSLVPFIVGSGGWLLIGIAANSYMGREALVVGWKSERGKWIGSIMAFIIAIVMVAVAVWILLP